MTCTISSDLLENIEKTELNYFSDLLMVFANRENTHKVTIDENNLVIEKYENVKQNLVHIKSWLDLMSYSPSAFEKVEVDLNDIDCNESFFIELCKETNGNKSLVVYSLQNIKTVKLKENFILIDGDKIEVLDRDTARVKVCQKNIIEGDLIEGDKITDSIVAKGKKNKISKK